MTDNTHYADHFIKTVLASRPETAVSFYFMASYLYYKEDKSLMSDEMYDKICQMLVEDVDKMSEHKHYGLLDQEALKAGTGYQIKDYPASIQNAAKMFYEEYVENVRKKYRTSH